MTAPRWLVILATAAIYGVTIGMTIWSAITLPPVGVGVAIGSAVAVFGLLGGIRLGEWVKWKLIEHQARVNRRNKVEVERSMVDIRPFGDSPFPINMCWECPVCGAQVGQVDSDTAIVTLHPPVCQLGHAKTEMEQRSAERWGRQFDEEAGS